VPLARSVRVDREERTLAERPREEGHAGTVRRPLTEGVPGDGIAEEREVRSVGPHQRQAAVTTGIGMEHDPGPGEGGLHRWRRCRSNVRGGRRRLRRSTLARGQDEDEPPGQVSASHVPCTPTAASTFRRALSPSSERILEELDRRPRASHRDAGNVEADRLRA
jgi:hypothetical protein